MIKPKCSTGLKKLLIYSSEKLELFGKSHVTQKILIPQSCDVQMICSVDCREQNGILSFSMLPMVWAAGSR